ncbi:hypothetical protein BDR04DRAFT_1121114 [Suillus decipiens]|nr:hypothetical protein BDR04DRAFT_1121114 [Suillus decipiens]
MADFSCILHSPFTIHSVEEVTSHHWHTLYTGMRVFVLGSWKDKKGGLLTPGFMKSKDWQVILLVWEDFIGNEFGKSPDLFRDQKATLLTGNHWAPKPYHEFELDQLGSLMLPEINSLALKTKKEIIQSFLTIHYRTCCGKPKETQVGPTFMFKAWMDDKGRMHSPVGKDESDGDVDNESPRPRPTT